MESGEGRRYRIGISGSYGGLNLGDEAILQSIITQLRFSLPVEFTIFSRNAEDTRQRYNVEHVVPVRDLTRAEVLPHIRHLDLFILGGGGILFDTEAGIFLREVEIAQQEGVPVMLYAVGTGPLHNPAEQKKVREALTRVAAITVREREAKKVLEEIGIPCEVIVTADPALLMDLEPLPDDIVTREHLDTGRPLIGMSVREPGPAAPDINQDMYHALLANAADFMIERFDADIIFVPMERLMKDMQHSHAVIAQMLRPQHAWVLKGEYTPGQILSLIGRFEFAVGMRLHFLIFAALQDVPFVALPYSSKVGDLLDELRIATPPIRLVNAGRLLAYIDHSWDERPLTRKRIAELLPVLKERARKSNEIAVELLTRGMPSFRTCPVKEE